MTKHIEVIEMSQSISLTLILIALASSSLVVSGASRAELYEKLHKLAGWDTLCEINSQLMQKNKKTLQALVADYLSEYWLQGRNDQAIFDRFYKIKFEDPCIELYSIYYDDQGFFDHLKYTPEESLSAVKPVVWQCNNYMSDDFKRDVYALIS